MKGNNGANKEWITLGKRSGKLFRRSSGTGRALPFEGLRASKTPTATKINPHRAKVEISWEKKTGWPEPTVRSGPCPKLERHLVLHYVRTLCIYVADLVRAYRRRTLFIACVGTCMVVRIFLTGVGRQQVP